MPGLHHYHRRQRLVKNKSEGKLIKIFDRIIYVVAILGPLTTLPQIIKIWNERNADGVAASTWCAFLFFNTFWITYGILHREKPIIITYILWFLMNGSVALGAILYG
jgi:uncharacterized protein with PQ loop repeat